MQVDRILHYRIEQHLGSGSFGDVYLAYDEKLDRYVAIKMAAPNDDEELQKEATTRFELEIGATVKLVHPNIVTVYDAGATDDCMFYVMAHLPGGDLKKNNNSISGNAAIAQVVIDVARALAYAHDMGFVHRDIKPENILFDAHGNAVLADFGIVKAMGQDYTMGHYIMGTSSFSAPEQLDANEEIDGRADLYSLGKVLHFMLTKQKYGAGENDSLPVARALFQPALNKLLSTDKNDRFQSAQEVIRSFEALLQGIRRDETLGAEVKPQMEQSGMQKSTLGLVIAVSILLTIGGLLLVNHADNGSGPTARAFAEDQIESDLPTDNAKDDEPSEPAVAVATDAIVSITSQPEGAEVLLDGAVVGVTPFMSESMPVGEQTLTLQKRFYQPQSLTLVLESNKVAKRDLRLVLGSGGLSIITEPAGARVWIDGESITGKTPLSIDNVSAGPRTIDIRVGNTSRRMEVDVPHAQVTLLRASLDNAAGVPDVSVLPPQGGGSFSINSNPPGAEVYIDGVKSGQTPFESSEISAGIHQVSLRHKFYVDVQFETEFSQQSPVKRFVELKPGAGNLSVITEPEGATVWLDNKKLKGLTPLSLDKVSAGHHNIDIRKDALRLEKDIEVTHDASTIVEGALTAGTLIAFNERWFSAKEMIAVATVSKKIDVKLKIYRAILADQPEHEDALAELGKLKDMFLKELEKLREQHSYDKARKFAALITDNFSEYFELPDMEAETDEHQQVHEQANLKARFAKQDKRIRELLQARHFAEADSLMQQLPETDRSLDAYRTLIRYAEQQKNAFSQQVLPHTGPLALVQVKPKQYLRAFAHEVTFRQWDNCVSDGMCSHRPDDQSWGRGERPVVNVSYEDITDQFIPWINRKTGLTFKLPTEAEWQALYGNASRVDHRQANGPTGFDWGEDGAKHTAIVGSYQKNTNGLYDLNGNVWEWVDQCADSECARRLLKGGSWKSAPKFFSSTAQWPEFPAKRGNDIGFRLVEVYGWDI